MQIPTYIIDSFTSTPFKGNPTAVCFINSTIDADIMLSIAKELNFPVTAFIKERSSSTNEHDIKYFTSITEIHACGHATLAAAKAVFDKHTYNTTTFYTNNNIIKTILESNGYIMMNYPKYGLKKCTINKELLNSLNIKQYKSIGYCAELETLFIEVENPEILTAIQPNYNDLLNTSNIIKEVVITTGSKNTDYEYLLRSFCPWIGINEDPVTGSVHSVLADFWKQKLNKNIFKVYQASERGGELLVKAFDNKVEISGKALIILKGNITI